MRIVNGSVAGPVFDHLYRMSDGRGLFEHARHDDPRPEHGYCLDDAARALVVVCREPYPSPKLQALTGAMLNGPAAGPLGPPAGTPVDGRQPAVPVQAVAWYDQAFAPDEMAAVFEGQIEEPAAAADKPGQPRIMGRAVVIYREEP